MPDTEKRELHVRAKVDAEKRTVTGRGVPYGETITIWGYRERFEAGSIEGEGAKLFYRHSEPIGLAAGADGDGGWDIEGTFSSTPRADEAYALARDGVLDGLSIGFEPLEWHTERDDDGREVTVYTRARVREVSLVPFPAYPSATVTEVREDPNNKEKHMPTATEERAAESPLEVRELREEFADMQRQLAVIADNTTREVAPVADTRSVGAVLKAMIAGDEDTIRAYNELLERDYEGGVLADAVDKPGWVGDLTRIFDASSGALADTFSTGTLPATGSSIEFAELDTNSVTVTEQVNEGDDIPMGNVKLKTRTAPVKTYAGGSELSRQSIERSTIGVLNTTMEALALAAGVRKKLVLRAAFNALVADRIAASDTIEIPSLATADAYDWLDAVIDAAINFEEKGGTVDAAVVSTDVFKSLIRLETEGRRVFRVGGDRTIGELDLTGLNGDIAGLVVRLDTAATAGSAAFVNGRAIRQYDSPLVTLSDDKISNLTKQFAVYRYGAVAAEIPGFVVPVEFGA